MSYEKLGFVSGQKLKAEHLNHMEEGIANTSWNDLADKPFGEEVTECVVLAECQADYNKYDEQFDIREQTNIPTFVAGETYIVVWNGVEYICIGQDVSAMTGEENDVYLGDLTSGGLDGNGEPFIIYRHESLGVPQLNIIPLDGTTELTLSIRQKQETIKPIDEKYLPDSVKGGGGNSDVVVVTMSQETMKLSHTPAEITSLLQAGKIVLCSATQASFTCDFDGKSATTVAITDVFGDICAVKYTFDESGTLSSTNFYKVTVTE